MENINKAKNRIRRDMVRKNENQRQKEGEQLLKKDL